MLTKYFIDHPDLHTGVKRVQRNGDNSQDRAISDIPEYPSTSKAGHRHSKQGRRIGAAEPINRRS